MLKNPLLRVLLVLANVVGAAPLAHADCPDRPIKLIMPYATGAGAIVPGYDAPAWMGLAVAHGTPEPAVAKLESAVMDVFSDPTTKIELSKAGIEIAPLGRHAFGTKMARPEGAGKHAEGFRADAAVSRHCV